MRKTKLFLMNAAIMTATSLLLNSVGVWFNLYIAGKIGAEGMGIFQLMTSVYGMAVTFAVSGIHLATTRLVAVENVGAGAGVRAVMRRCLCYSFCFGMAAAAVLFFGAPAIGGRWLGAAVTIRPLRVMAVTLPFLAISCAMNGYFTAVRRVAKCALVQILEQFLKIMLTMLGLLYLLPPGLEYACLSITLAGAVAETLSFLFELLLYLLDIHRYQSGKAPVGLTPRLLEIALPVAFSSYLRTGLSTVKHLLVPVCLQRGGLAAGASFSVFGVVHGLALPIIQFPYAFLSAFNSLIIPELAQYHSQNRDSNPLMQKILRLTLGFSFGVCGIVFCFSGEIAAAVSGNPDVGVYIHLLAPIIPVMYLDTAVDNMLKGINEQVSVMRYNVIDAVLSLAGVWLLLPVLGIKGYLLVICGSEVLNFALSLTRLVKVTRVRLNLTEQLVKPMLCIAIAVLLTNLLQYTALQNSPAQAQAILLVGCSGGLYLALLLLCGWAKFDT